MLSASPSNAWTTYSILHWPLLEKQNLGSCKYFFKKKWWWYEKRQLLAGLGREGGVRLEARCSQPVIWGSCSHLLLPIAAAGGI